MKVKELYILELSRIEAEALKILLGTFSNNDKNKLGLSDQEMIIISDLYWKLPYRDDE